MDYFDVTDVLAAGHNALDKMEACVRGSWLHRWFWHSVNVRWYAPPVHLATSWELDYPFRKGHTILLRYSFRRSAVLGFWGKRVYDEDTALLEATIHGRKRRQDELQAWDDTETRDTAQQYYTVSKTRAANVGGLVLWEGPRLRDGATTDARADAG